MTTRLAGVLEERQLRQWEFAVVPDGHRPTSLPEDVWTPVQVPHVAEEQLEDVRSGGRVAYRTKLRPGASDGIHELVFDGVSYRCEISVDGRAVGRHEGAWDPFVVELEGLDPGRTSEVVVVVDLVDYDPDSPLHFRTALLGFVPDTVGPFGGLWRPVTYRRRPAPRLADVRFAVDQRESLVTVSWRPRDTAGPKVSVELVVEGPEGEAVAVAVADSAARMLTVRASDAAPWSSTTPVLHDVRLRVLDGTEEEYVQRTGFRRARVDGRRILLDEQPTYLRGVLHWGHYPELRTPSPDPAQARAELELIRSLGFTMVKFCLFLAPAHYYDLCDELGMVVWQEFPLWLPRDNGSLESRVREQYPRMVDVVAAHPSVLLVSLGCELDETMPTHVLDWAYDVVRERIPDAIVCANSGSGECFGGGSDARSDIYDYHFYADPHELEGLLDAFAGEEREPRPWIFGEYNDADTWRTAAEFIPGSSEAPPVWLSPDPAVNPLHSVHAGFASDQPVYRQAEIIAEEGYADEVPGLTELSHRQAEEIRRHVLELTRSTPAVGGYVITVLRDIPATTSGLLDDGGRLKFDARAVADANADVVLAVRSPLRRRWHRGGDRLRPLDPHNVTVGSTHSLGLVVANATVEGGPAQVGLRLEVAGRTVSTHAAAAHVPPHDVRHLVDVEWTPDLPPVDRATTASLVAEVAVSGRVLRSSRWPVVVHPPVPRSEGVLLLDPAGRLEGLAELVGAVQVPSVQRLREELERGGNRALLTTVHNDVLRSLTTDLGLHTFVADEGTGTFELTRGPFWRENVKRAHRGTWLADALPEEHLGVAQMALAGDAYVTRHEIRRVVGDHVPLLTRYDARTYRVGEYVFEWHEGAGRTVWSTLRLAGGVGSQPRMVADNPAALSVLTSFLRSVP